MQAKNAYKRKKLSNVFNRLQGNFPQRSQTTRRAQQSNAALPSRRYYYALVVSMLAVTFQRCAPQSTTTVLGLTLMT